jgi:hypothetical protein
MRYLYEVDGYMCEGGTLESREKSWSKKDALKMGTQMSKKFPFVEVNKILVKMDGSEIEDYEEFVEQVKSWRR